MTLVSRILCVFGRHMRSRGHARNTPEGWRSRCRRCGRPMLREGEDGPWLIDEEAIAIARAGRRRRSGRQGDESHRSDQEPAHAGG